MCKRVERPGSHGEMGLGNAGVSGPKAGRHRGCGTRASWRDEGTEMPSSAPSVGPSPLSLPSFLGICPSQSWSYTQTSEAFLGMRELLRGMKRPSYRPQRSIFLPSLLLLVCSCGHPAPLWCDYKKPNLQGPQSIGSSGQPSGHSRGNRPRAEKWLTIGHILAKSVCESERGG